MGKHRMQARRWRGISSGLVWAVVALAVVIAVVVAWVMIDNRSKDEGRTAAAACVEGTARVVVATNTQLAQPLTRLADSFNATKPVARDHCISVSVRAIDEATVLAGTKGSWDESRHGPMPTGWIPSSSLWSAQLIAAQPTKVNGTPRSLVRSPVMLAVAAPVEPRIADTGWATIPALHNTDGSLVLTGLVGWGSLRLAMPTGPDSDATFLATQAMAAGGKDQLTASAASSSEFADTVRTMTDRAPKTRSTTDALTGLADDPTAENLTHAVVATEQQLYAHTAGWSPRQKSAIKTMIPAGATPVADFPVVRLSGRGVDQAQTEGLDRFISYVSEQQHLSTLTRAGFRAVAGAPASPLPGPSSVSDFAPLGTTLRTPGDAQQNAITDLLRGA